ncbi:hypothetical protein [Nocardioides perillae]|uniref:Uncharacterized protein n=1 Tax=Nocardioides perillae TaxID=1119534 RepID=A0A7Y9RWI0_9ACTN|nr:hypothetical protein [Nocardioides perillae]NYG55404.1 hypothetical protein [Nocardioides perillae]
MRAPDVPAPLVTAASLAAVEGLLLVLVGVAEVASLTGGRLTMGLTTAVFFLAAGGGLVACGWALAQGRAWGRGPVLLAQVMALAGAWSVRSTYLLVSLLLLVVAVVVAVGVLHPASIALLEGSRLHDEPDDVDRER